MNFILNLHTKLLKIEKFLLVSIFIITLSIAVLQIFLRNFFDGGIIWGDSFLRISVLWIGLMGALFASRNNNHIRIDLAINFLPKKYISLLTSFIHLFTGFICSLIAWYAAKLVLMEYEYAEIAFADIPVWITMLIIPTAFIIMSLRYLNLAIQSLITKQ